MKINDAERITGLTQKAIRLYESKGLVSIARDENGYRNYSNENIELLKRIKLFRSVGISISDIKLYIFGLMSLEEMADKRKSEILKESGNNSENYRICENLSKGSSVNARTGTAPLTEAKEISTEKHGALTVGIDIGTTTVSAVVYDIDNRRQLEAYALPHRAGLCSDVFSVQSVSVLLEKAEKLLSHLLTCYSGVIGIGLSGQMHGIVYIDAEGRPVSDLINWQDKRADIPMSDGKTTCERINSLTGERIAAGYGIATHCYNLQCGLVPASAVGLCSIADLFALRICGAKKAVMHASMAAALGLFDVKKGDFSDQKLSLLGIDRRFLPSVTTESKIIERCGDIPVAVAIGDNQASFLGSVSRHGDSVLVNIGTGSQVSVVSEYREPTAEIEIRPFIDGKYLACASALCGGHAYAMVEAFFRSYAVSAGMQEVSQYQTINRLALLSYESGEECPAVDVSFLGKRSDPQKRGSIAGIGEKNFTPSAFILGVLRGMCNELYELYCGFEEKRATVVASGGAVRKNKILRDLIADRFGVPVSVSTVEEEAATGAALFSAYILGYVKYRDGFFDYLNYSKGKSDNEY